MEVAMPILELATNWNEYFRERRPIAWLFREADGGEFLAVVDVPGAVDRTLLFEGNGALMSPHATWRVASEALDGGESDTVTLTFISDNDDALDVHIEAVTESEYRFFLPGSEIEWRRVPTKSYVMYLPDDHETLRVSLIT
jgi:hypothetical protein